MFSLFTDFGMEREK